MSKKWYFGTLITALALLVVIQQQVVVPNQEIVLEFVNADVSSPEAQNAITIVKKQLESIGVKNTRISRDLEDGKLKIAYYSDADVTYIKRILSEGQSIALDHVFYDQNKGDKELPTDKNVKDYNLDVYEIQKSTDFETDFNGLYVLEIQQEKDGYSNYNPHSFGVEFDYDDIDRLVKVAQKINRNIAIAIDNTSHNTPEVRAGPTS
ncbi:hypothetical protein [Aquimarina sp. 2201CG5-10]|uniref:hypothetical protein n=1 Tax=Aquimarina callyspongiae TaxID=3098150 RepID=UPI002AB33F16|nr:hypothetical protein [Aquimarina sp. 2201CG5-10]MDY8138577.1 hypothetical protein [Aquimarina sp. 2201CG5-10]